MSEHTPSSWEYRAPDGENTVSDSTSGYEDEEDEETPWSELVEAERASRQQAAAQYDRMLAAFEAKTERMTEATARQQALQAAQVNATLALMAAALHLYMGDGAPQAYESRARHWLEIAGFGEASPSGRPPG